MKTSKISVVVVFYNNRREAKRTLFTLSSGYQKGIDSGEYEVIAIDNNSSKPIDGKLVESFGSNFKYQYLKKSSISPCQALNIGIKAAKHPNVMCIIDGAHMLSPGVLKESQTVLAAFPKALVYTLPFHLGSILQNDSMLSGYNQKTEDLLLDTIDWKNNGYQLFGISEIENANHSFFNAVLESNCFTINKEILLAAGGFDERFTSKGGGMTNLDVFKKLVEDFTTKQVALIGEASFHQYHGGVSTNVKREKHPLPEYRNEYKRIKGKEYTHPNFNPYFWGHFPKPAEKYMPRSFYRDILKMARKLVFGGEMATAISLLKFNKSINEFNIGYYDTLGLAYSKLGNNEEAEKALNKMLELAPYSVEANVKLTDLLIRQNKIEEAQTVLDNFAEFENEHPRIYLRLIQIARQKKAFPKVNQYLESLMSLIRSDCNYLASIYIEVGKKLTQLQKVEFAKQTLQKGLTHHKNNSTMLMLLGKLAFSQKKFQNAENYFVSSINNHQQPSSGLFIALADSYLMQNKSEKAIQTLEKARAIDPENKVILEKLAQVAGKA